MGHGARDTGHGTRDTQRYSALGEQVASAVESQSPLDPLFPCPLPRFPCLVSHTVDQISSSSAAGGASGAAKVASDR